MSELSQIMKEALGLLQINIAFDPEIGGRHISSAVKAEQWIVVNLAMQKAISDPNATLMQRGMLWQIIEHLEGHFDNEDIKQARCPKCGQHRLEVRELNKDDYSIDCGACGQILTFGVVSCCGEDTTSVED